MPSIADCLQNTEFLGSSSARLDVELLLTAALEKPRSYLHTWPQQLLDQSTFKKFESFVQRRKTGEPIAYILGKQGFWNLNLTVNSSTLIPRPETELLVETALQLLPQSPMQVLDLGTGSGAIALALASERRAWHLTATDRVPEAVSLAQCNAQQLAITNVEFVCAYWFDTLLNQSFDLIVSNPPYIAQQDQHLQRGDVRFEPASALVSGIDGLLDLKQIIEQAPNYLKTQGWLLLEHGSDQAECVQTLLQERGFVQVSSLCDLAGYQRISMGQWHG